MKCYFKYILSVWVALNCCEIAYADDDRDLKSTMPVVEANIKAIEPKILSCLQDEKGDSVIIRISYKADGSIKKVNIEGADKKTRTCIREAFANVTFDIDVTSIIDKQKAAVIPTKPIPKYGEDANGNLIRVGYRQGTLPAYMPEGKVTYVYHSKDKSLAVKSHYMIGRLR
ncbi:MAG: hypothetical protein II180_01355 [Proteobacteria bacterium]|nr:hypothetical protein [Pseudomonadota bacterium]